MHQRALLAVFLRRRLDGARARMAQLEERMQALGPLSVLSRGYSLAFNEQGTLLRDASTVELGDSVTIVLARGRLGAKVEQVEKALAKAKP